MRLRVHQLRNWNPISQNIAFGRCQGSLGVVYIMEHEIIPCSSKICDWPLNSSRDHFSLHQEKEGKSDHET